MKRNQKRTIIKVVDMGKRHNNTASAFNIAIAGQVGHTHIKKKDILTNNYIANQDSHERKARP